MRDPDHKVLDKPWEYEIVRLLYNAAPADAAEPYLDLGLRFGEAVRTLRFLSPQSLAIEEGFPSPTRGLVILDVSKRGLDGLNVLVDDFENTAGKIRFWARKVIEVDRTAI